MGMIPIGYETHHDPVTGEETGGRVVYGWDGREEKTPGATLTITATASALPSEYRVALVTRHEGQLRVIGCVTADGCTMTTSSLDTAPIYVPAGASLPPPDPRTAWRTRRRNVPMPPALAAKRGRVR
jgi:hypothetical protein